MLDSATTVLWLLAFFTSLCSSGTHLRLRGLMYLTASSRLLALRLKYEIPSQCHNFSVSLVSFECDLKGLQFNGLQTQENNDVLAYWLSNTSTLLFLLQRTLKASGAGGPTPQRRRANSVTLFGRMTQVRKCSTVLCLVRRSFKFLAPELYRVYGSFLGIYNFFTDGC
jgi:hypothetical protein